MTIASQGTGDQLNNSSISTKPKENPPSP